MQNLTRRSFVTTSARGIAGLAAGASVLGRPQSAGARGANEKILLGLIGAGGRGSALAQNFSKLKDVEFKYLCDVNEGRGGDLLGALEKTQGRRPQRVKDLRRVLEDKEVDGVVIATPEHWHALATVWACQAGKDVYVEKNPSLTIWEGRKMIEAARKYNRIVQF